MKKKLHLIIGLSLITNITLFIFSFLFFLNILQHPSLSICGSACEYWWSWILDIPPEPPCIEVCIQRNALYKPFFVAGLIFMLFTLFGGLFLKFATKRS